MGEGRTDAHVATNSRATVVAAGEFAKQVGAYASLTELGCTQDMVPALVRTALADPVTQNTPRLPTAAELRDVILSPLGEAT